MQCALVFRFDLTTIHASAVSLAAGHVYATCVLSRPQDVRHRGCGSGDYEGTTYFECDKGHGKFVPVSELRPDPRFVEEPQGNNRQYYPQYNLP